MPWNHKQPDLTNNSAYLEPRLTTAESSLATMTTKKADVTYVDTKTASIASGSPKGVYSTLSALQTAYPTGNTNVYLVTGNVKEVDTLTISAIPTTAGNVTVTLNGVATNIAVDPTTDTTTSAVATKIRNTAFSGWITGGTGATVTFTATAAGTKTAPSYSAGTTGTTGTISVTTAGVNVDGQWYYWNSSAWSAGGVYQSTGISDKGVNTKKLAGPLVENKLTDLHSHSVDMVNPVEMITDIESFTSYATSGSYMTYGQVNGELMHDYYEKINADIQFNRLKLYTFINVSDYTSPITITFYKGKAVKSDISYIADDIIFQKVFTATEINDQLLDRFNNTTNKSLIVNSIKRNYLVVDIPTTIHTLDYADKVDIAITTTDVNGFGIYTCTTKPSQKVPKQYRAALGNPFGDWTLNPVYYELELVENSKITDKFALKSDIPTILGSFWKDKAANFLGDSITAGYNTTYIYHDEVKRLLGLATVRNYGVSGSTIATPSPDTGVASFISRYSSMDNNADLIFVLGGTNDYNLPIALGTISDTTGATFYGALDVLCKGLINKYPSKTIVFGTPTKRHASDEESRTKLAPLTDYVKAVLDVCGKYAIPVIDLNKMSNIYADVNVTSPLLSDGLHPNEAGHTSIGRKIANYINML